MASFSFSTSASVNGTDSSIVINSHGIEGVQEIRYEYGDNASPTSIGLVQGIFYVLAKDTNSVFIMDSLDHVKYFVSGFENLIDISTDTIQMDHSFSTGDKVVYNNNGGTDLGGLFSFTDYYVIVVSATKIKLASTLSDSSNNIAVNLTSLGDGYSQCLFKKKTITPSTTNQTIR